MLKVTLSFGKIKTLSQTVLVSDCEEIDLRVDYLILHAQKMQRISFNEVTENMYFQLYEGNVQTLLIVHEKDDFYAVVKGEYDEVSQLINDEVKLNYTPQTIYVPRKPKQGDTVLCLTLQMTKSMPPKINPQTVYILSEQSL